LSPKTEKIIIQLKYRDIEQQFSAEPQDAWLLLAKFFNGVVPSFEIAQNLLLNVDLERLAKDIVGIVAFSSEGPNLLVPKNILTDNEVLLISLVAHYLGRKLGLVNCDSRSKEELQAKLGKSGKITSTRLGELIKNELVTKDPDGRFRITTFGIVQVQKEVIPKIKAKTSR
jgi:hypothetical protein